MSKKVFAIILSFFCYAFFLSFPPSVVYADNDTQGVFCDIKINGITVTPNRGSRTTIPFSNSSNDLGTQHTYSIEACGDLTQASGEALILAKGSGWSWSEHTLSPNPSQTQNSCVSGDFILAVNAGTSGVNLNIDIETESGNTPICRRGYVQLKTGGEDDWLAWENAKTEMCNISIDPSSNITTEDTITLYVPLPDALSSNRTGPSNSFENPSGEWEDYQVTGTKPDGSQFVSGWLRDLPVNANGLIPLTFVGSDLGVGTFTVGIRELTEGNPLTPICQSYRFEVGTPQNPGDAQDLFDPGEDNFGEPVPFELCAQLVPDSKAQKACVECRNNASGSGVWTAVGCINSDPAIIIATVVKLGVGIGGGVALLLILVAGFMFTTSQGDPNKTKEAKDLLQSAIIGLLFIIFSVTILQFLGVQILKIPGFAST